MEHPGRTVDPQPGLVAGGDAGTLGLGRTHGPGRPGLHICVVLPPIEPYSASGGAIATVVHNVASEWEHSGHSVTVIAPRGDAPPYPVATSLALDLRNGQLLRSRFASRFDRRSMWDWPDYRHYLRAVTGAIRAVRPAAEVVVAHNDLQLLPELGPYLPEAETVLWLHNEVRTARPDPLESVDRIVAVSDYVARWTERHYGLPGGVVHTAYNGVDLERFHPGEWDRSPGSPLRVVCHGRIDPGKGFHLAVASVGRLRGRGVAVELTVAGGLQAFGISGVEAAAYRDDLLASLAQIGGTYLGRLDPGDVPALLRNADVACVPSVHPDPFPLTALEAMASGCALVASDRGGLPEACGAAGMVVDPEDPAALDTALAALAGDPDLLADRQRAARTRAEQFPWSAPAAIALGQEPGSPT